MPSDAHLDADPRRRGVHMAFAESTGLEVTDALGRALVQDGIDSPTAVQQSAIPHILAGRHVVMHSGTGTGKTLAYVLPILQRLRLQSTGRAAIFAPATELAMQILRVIDRYKDSNLASAPVVATASHRRQKSRVQRSTRIVVGTPGRLLDLIAARKLPGLTTIVLDEPDPILMGEGGQYLREVLSRPDPKVQLVLAGATLGPRAEQLIVEVMGADAIRLENTESPLHAQIKHSLVHVPLDSAKDVRMARFIAANRCERAIVFVNQDHQTRHLYRYFTEHALRPVSLGQERSKQERQQALAQFARSEARLLITSDVAARGLDVPDVTWVLHYELPHSAPAYVHRAGRTGRAGKTGHSVVFVIDDERALLKRYARELKIEFRVFEKS